MPQRETLSKLAWLLLGWLTWSQCDCPELNAQQVQFPQNTFVPNASNPWNPPVGSGNPVFSPSNASAPWPTAGGIPGGPNFGQPTVTPFGPPFGNNGFGGQAASSPGATIRPNSAPLLPQSAGQLPPTANSWNLGNWFGAPNGYNQPYPSGLPYGTNQPLANSYPSSVYPNSTPPTLFPNGYGSSPSPTYGGAPPTYGSFGTPFQGANGQGSLFSNSLFNSNNWRLGNGWFNGNTMNGPLINGQIPLTSRFFVAPRVRHTWIAADDRPDSLGINDTDLSLIFQVPRFLGSTQPLYIAPSFSSHLWDGPKGSVADLPASAYSAFLDFGWETDPLRTFGTELGVRVGVFSDYNTFNSESLRILGKALGRVRLTPTSTGRLGVFWTDRNRIKLVPAGGILWVPNADTRFDLFFPEPKLSHYVSTLGNTDMWWYATGFFGGGAWTVSRKNGEEDSIDLQDMRIALGLEWGRNELLRQGHRFAFFEGGYVFNRKLIYRYRPLDSIDIDNSYMLRAGIIY